MWSSIASARSPLASRAAISARQPPARRRSRVRRPSGRPAPRCGALPGAIGCPSTYRTCEHGQRRVGQCCLEVQRHRDSSAIRRDAVASARCCAVIRVASATRRWNATCGTAPCSVRGTPRPRTKCSRSTRPSRLRAAGEREALRNQASQLAAVSGPASTNRWSATRVRPESPWVSARCTTASAWRCAVRTISSSTASDGSRMG